MLTQDIPINHRILAWARKKANLSLERAAQKAKITAIKNKRSAEILTPSLRLQKWENREGAPTYHQLVNLAKAYKRPFLTFFLPEPPEQEIRVLDYRTMGNKRAEILGHEAEFSALIRQTEATQKSVRELLAASDSKPLPFVGTASAITDPNEVVTNIRSVLGCDLKDRTRVQTPDRFFSYLRGKCEALGVYVMVQGDLGSYHTTMLPEVFRGFTLSDSLAPFIVINPNDTKTANLFTLLHELCHVWLGETAISNWISLDPKSPKPTDRERFCDQVAAEFLAPKAQLLERWGLLTIGYDADSVIKRIAREFRISPIVIARRLLEFQKITQAAYWTWYEAYQFEWLQIKEQLQKGKKEKKTLSIRTRARTKLGGGLINTVFEATRQGKISELDASIILNVKIDHFSKIA